MKHSRACFAMLAAFAALGCLDTASAQPVLIVTPATTAANPLAFNNIPAGGISKPQTVTVTTGDMTMTSVTIQVNPSSPWIVISPGASVNTPASLNISCNTANLAAGSYNGSFTITVNGAPTDQVTVYVSLTVTGTTLLSANPPSVSFTGLEGASIGNPASAQVQIVSAGAQLTYNLSAQTTDGGNWLLLSTTSGNTSASGPQFSVSVNPSAVTPTNVFPQTYYGIITAASTTTNDAVQISVQLTITAVASVSVTPAMPAPFVWQVGTPDPPAEQIAVGSSGGTTAFTIQENPAVSWLVLSALSGIAGSAPAIIHLNATPNEQGLSPGTYTTTLVVTPSGQASLPPIPIMLVVANHPVLQLTTNALTFTAPFAGSSPPSQMLTVSASGGASVGFNLSSNVSWLSATASGPNTPATITVQVNPAGLAEQTYTGTLSISPTSGDSYVETVTVTFAVTASALIRSGPPTLYFSYETGQAPPGAQVAYLQSNGQIVQFSMSTATSTCGGNWFDAQVNSTYTDATLTVTVMPAGLSPGICSGVVTLTYNSGSGLAMLGIPVTLQVSNAPELAVSLPAGFGLYTSSQVSAPIQQQITLTSTDPANQVPFNVTVTSAASAWLGVMGSTTGTTPYNLQIEIAPDEVPVPGVYAGMINISSPSLATLITIPVTLTVTSNTTVTVMPGSLSFAEFQGGATPPAQALALASSPGIATYTAEIAEIAGGNWLQISPISGNANGSIQVSILPNSLAPADYHAIISLGFQGAATTGATVNVTLHVTAPPAVSVMPTSLTFSAQAGGAAPGSQTLQITSTGGSANVSVGATPSNWLSVSPASGATPQTITVSVNPAGLPPQVYRGSVTVSSTALSAPITIPVTLNVNAAPMPQPILILNAATGAAGVIAPGEILTITGNLLGPATPATGVSFSVNSATGKVDSTLAGVQVTFDNIPGIPIFVSAGQINVIAPYEIAGRVSTAMVVSYNQQSSVPDQLAVASVAPGLFTDNFTGQGQVAAINQDGSYNGASGAGYRAIPRGQVISLYGTGGGQTSPFSFTGAVTPTPANPSQLLNIVTTTATIGGMPATVTFAGAAPGLVSGVIQVNVIVPPGVAPGPSVPVVISVGGVASPLGTTIAVQ